MAKKPTILVDRGRRRVGEAGMPAHRAYCPDCDVTSVHKHSAMAVGIIAEHGEKVHGWTVQPNVKPRRP